VVKFIAARRAPPRPDIPDAELVRQVRRDRGDELAFRALVARYGPMVWPVPARDRRSHLAEDAFQAALLVFARQSR